MSLVSLMLVWVYLDVLWLVNTGSNKSRFELNWFRKVAGCGVECRDTFRQMVSGGRDRCVYLFMSHYYGALYLQVLI